MNHPNIIHLEDVYEVPDRIYMVMEIMSGGELFDYVVEKGTLKEEEASRFIRQISSALAYMHNKGIIHRDLKPGIEFNTDFYVIFNFLFCSCFMFQIENLLLKSKDENPKIKIIDFGLAKV
jgi:calcium/calmodulin-dependent protein kinase I